MPWVLPAIATFVAALTITEIIVIASVIAVGAAFVMRSKVTGVASAPVTPGSAYQTNPLQLTVSADAPRRMVYGKARISGVVAYMNVQGAGHEFLWIVVVIAAHKISNITQIYFDGEKPEQMIPSPIGFFSWYFYDGSQVVADPQLMAAFPEWTSNCILKGCAYAVVKMKYDKAAWKNGRPNISFDVKGKDDIVDKRTNPPTVAWSNNGALCVANFMTSPDGLGATDDEIDWDTVNAAATIAAQLPAELAASMCDGRYTIDGVIELSARNGDTINAMLSACAGTIVWTEGKYRLFVGASRAFVGTITSEDLRDNPSLQPRIPTDQSFNCVKGTFLDSTNNWVFSDFPPVIGTPYVAIDGGTKVFRDIVFQFTTSPITAQRLATIFLRRARLEKTITLPCKWTVFNFEVWDVVKLRLPQLGWVDKLFQITDWKMMPPKSNEPGGIELTLVEYADDTYADNIVFKPVTPGGIIVRPDITNPAALSVLYATSGAGTGDANGNPYIRFDWPSSVNIYATGYLLAYGKYPFAPVDSDYKLISGRSSSSATVGPLNPGDTYIGYIKVINTFDKVSAATASNTVVVKTIGSAVPPTVVAFTSTLVGTDSVDLAWSAPATPMAYTEIRWAATNDFNKSVIITRVTQPTNTVRLLRETTNGFYFAAFVSTGGIYGPTASVATIGRVPATVLLTVDLNRRRGDLVNAIWVADSVAVSKSQRLASELGWEVFDLMVPQPFQTISYYSKAQSYVVSGSVRASGSLGYNRAPTIPGVLPIVKASAQIAYFSGTVIKEGTTLLDSDANIKIGFTATNTDPQGVVFTAFNGTLEKL